MGEAVAKSESDQLLAIYAAQTAKVKWQTAMEIATAKGQYSLYESDCEALVTAANVEAEVSYTYEQLTQDKRMAQLEGNVNNTHMRWETEIQKAEVRRTELALAAEVGMLAHMEYEVATMMAGKISEASVINSHANAGATLQLGEAEAYAMAEMGKAVGEVMDLNAEAYADFTPAALLDSIVEHLVPLSGAFVKPLYKISSATLITDGQHAAGKLHLILT